MPGFRCRCDEPLSWSQIPCKIEYKFISDVEYDNYVGSIDAEDLYMEMKSFMKCPKCGRLWVFWSGFGKGPEEYVLVKRD